MTQPMLSQDEKQVGHVPSVLMHLIPTYLENRRNDIRSIGDALPKKDYDLIRRLGHSMKGSGGGFGLHAITDIGNGIEKAALEANDDDILSKIQELTHYLDHLDVVPIEAKQKKI